MNARASERPTERTTEYVDGWANEANRCEKIIHIHTHAHIAVIKRSLFCMKHVKRDEEKKTHAKKLFWCAFMHLQVLFTSMSFLSVVHQDMRESVCMCVCFVNNRNFVVPFFKTVPFSPLLQLFFFPHFLDMTICPHTTHVHFFSRLLSPNHLQMNGSLKLSGRERKKIATKHYENLFSQMVSASF